MSQDTIEEALQRASSLLKKAGLENPRTEAELLLAWAAGRGRLQLYLNRAAVLPQKVLTVFQAGVQQRSQGEPFAYITGSKEFFGLDFKVDGRVLIPRPETEFIVEAALGWAKGQEENIRGVDLGCGSGAIVVTLACLLPHAHFAAVDLSEGALQVAAENASRHGVADRVKFYQGDFFQAFQGVEPQPAFNLVLSNPPYISQQDFLGLPQSVKGFEPSLALDGGEDGLDAYRRILKLLPSYAQSPGFLALEIGAGQEQDVTKLCLETGLFHSIKSRSDYQGWIRVVEGLI